MLNVTVHVPLPVDVLLPSFLPGVDCNRWHRATPVGWQGDGGIAAAVYGYAIAGAAGAGNQAVYHVAVGACGQAGLEGFGPRAGVVIDGDKADRATLKAI